MIKQKLATKRIEKKFTQEEMADLIDISQSQYSRKENGITKISKKEWIEMAKVLNTSLEAIYEPEVKNYLSNKEILNTKNSNYRDELNQMRELAFNTLEIYIKKLEEENTILKERLRIK